MKTALVLMLLAAIIGSFAGTTKVYAAEDCFAFKSERLIIIRYSDQPSECAAEIDSLLQYSWRIVASDSASTDEGWADGGQILMIK